METMGHRMILHNFIHDSHIDDYDFVHWQRTKEYHAHKEEDQDDDGSSVDNCDGHTSYEHTGNRACMTPSQVRLVEDLDYVTKNF